MLTALRWQLTRWFVCLSILLYTALVVFAVIVFDAGMTRLLDEELKDLSREIRPSIEFVRDAPSLKTWDRTAEAVSTKLLATIQLYDRNGSLIEEYGPKGVPRLSLGRLEIQNKNRLTILRSRFIPLDLNGQRSGYLQIQLPTKGRDEAIREFTATVIILAPFLFIGLGISGYFFAGKAVRPTEENIKVLRRFIADAGHELNTPITIIQGSIETLEEAVTDAQRLDLLKVISRASNRMADLASNLMVLAKVESPQLMSAGSPVQLEAITSSVCQELSELFKSKNIALNYVTIEPAVVIGNPDSLRILLTNLLENAFHYSDEGGQVTVSQKLVGREVQIAIEDKGVGIPEDSIPRIFDRFYRVDKSRSRSLGGSGLGLAIVRAIVEAHHGSIKVESEEGVGSKFIISIPARLS